MEGGLHTVGSAYLAKGPGRAFAGEAYKLTPQAHPYPGRRG